MISFIKIYVLLICIEHLTTMCLTFATTTTTTNKIIWRNFLKKNVKVDSKYFLMLLLFT